MKILATLLAFALTASPAFAQERQPIRDGVAKAADTLAAQPAGGAGRGKLFWPGVAVGAAGVTTAVLAASVFRIESDSAGNSPASTYSECVAQKNSIPAYAGNDCNALKGKNAKLMWGGVALGAVGAVMTISGAQTGAQIEPGVIRFIHRVRF
jgi:hypothetical protein